MSERAETFIEQFVLALRAAGIAAPMERHQHFLLALRDLPPDSIDRLYWLARITLLQAADEIEPFDQLFDAWFRKGTVSVLETAEEEGEAPAKPPANQGPEAAPMRLEPGEGTGRAASADDLLHRGVFQSYNSEERAEDGRFGRTAVAALPLRLSRRQRPARRGRLDLRRTIRAAASRSGGEIVDFAKLARPSRRRRLVLLVDVSGSHKGMIRNHLRLARALIERTPCEIFCFGSRLTRLTPILARGQVDRALARALKAIPDFEGGTRIGPTLTALVEESRWSSSLRGSLVLVISDGLERGDPSLLAHAVGRIRRLAHRLVWLTPLKRDEAFHPQTRGLLAALPHLDRLGAAIDRAAILQEFIHLGSTAAAHRVQPRAGGLTR